MLELSHQIATRLLTQKKGNKIMAKAKVAKAEVQVIAPKITTAWINVCVITKKGELDATAQVLFLAKEINASQLSIRDVMKVIKDSGQESPIVKASHVEGLTTFAKLMDDKDFQALPLAQKLSNAVAAYKLLVVEVAQGLPTFEIVKSEVKKARANKAKKAKASGSTTKPKKANNSDVLKAFLAWTLSTDFTSLSDKEIEMLNEIQASLEMAGSVTA
jgi:hypothetical protein